MSTPDRRTFGYDIRLVYFNGLELREDIDTVLEENMVCHGANDYDPEGNPGILRTRYVWMHATKRCFVNFMVKSKYFRSHNEL